MSASLPSSKQENRVQAVLALFHGEPVAQVSRRFHICRSDLYKFRRLAYTAIEHAVNEKPRGPQRPHNHTEEHQEQEIVFLCQRYSTFSAHQIAEKLGRDAPSLRTIQRIRRRHHLGRFPKRPPVTHRTHRLTAAQRRHVQAVVRANPHLGAERIAWDLQNGDHLMVSPSTIKYYKRRRREELRPPRPAQPHWQFYERHHPHSLWHGDFMEKVTLTDLDRTAYQLTLLDDYSRGYVFCDLFLEPDARTTIHVLIAAMRQWQVIPKAVIFDNGQHFRGKLLTAFCEHAGVRLIHSTPFHPQTNGKLERSFRDDMRDFYKQYNAWNFETLRRDLPYYMYYRNHVRGHRALGGKPSITRLLDEHSRTASPETLEVLESYAAYEIGKKTIPATASIRLFGREAFVGRELVNREVTFFESLEGLEARIDGQCIAVLREYRTFRQMACNWHKGKIPPVLFFEPYQPAARPRIAVAS